HAYEKLLGYGNLTHGEAVALGMVLAARLSERLHLAAPGLEAKITATLLALGLPHDPTPPIYRRSMPSSTRRAATRRRSARPFASCCSRRSENPPFGVSPGIRFEPPSTPDHHRDE